MRRPMLHSDLTDSVEIEIRSCCHGAQDLRALPTDIAKHLGHRRLSVEGRLCCSQVLIAEDKEKECLVIAHGETGDLSPRDRMADVNEFVARSIPHGLECRHAITKRHLEGQLRSESDTPDPGMQPVRANDQVHVARSGSSKMDTR